MGITSKAKSENWGMGFLLIFFPEDQPPLPLTTTTTSSSSFKPTLSPLRRSTSNHLLTKTQSAISIFALLFFLSLLLLTLEPIPTNHLTRPKTEITILPSFALQGMGVLYRRGTKSMHDLIVGHVIDSLSPEDLRTFLRSFHFSNLSSKSDLVLIFPLTLNHLERVVSEETQLLSRPNSTLFLKLSEKEENPISEEKGRIGNSTKNEPARPEPIWEKKTRSNYTEENESTAESVRNSYGSVVSFTADELDPENSLSGFLDHVAMSMRRWACYPMLLGRVRRNFKHIVLVDVREFLLLGDPLTRPSGWVHLTLDAATVANHKHGRKVAAKRVDPGLIFGGARGVRRLANAMLTEIVRAATTAKRKHSLTESVILNQLAANDHVLKSANVDTAFAEPVPDASSGLGKFTAVTRRGNGNIDVNFVIRKHICSSLLQVNSSDYGDC